MQQLTWIHSTGWQLLLLNVSFSLMRHVVFVVKDALLHLTCITAQGEQAYKTINAISMLSNFSHVMRKVIKIFSSSTTVVNDADGNVIRSTPVELLYRVKMWRCVVV